MHVSGWGFGVLRGLLMVAGVVIFLVVAFYAALIAIGIAVVYFTLRAVIRALAGRGRTQSLKENVVIAPAYRATRTQSSATAQRVYVLTPQPKTSA